MARETCSIFDLLADAGIEPFVPDATGVAAADAAGGGGEAVAITDAGANADANADETNEDWWEGVGFRMRMRARLLSPAPRADADSDDEWWSGSIGLRSQASTDTATVAVATPDTAAHAVVIAAPDAADATTPLATFAPTPPPTQSPMPSPSPAISFPISVSDAIIASPSPFVEAINEVRSDPIFNLSYLVPFATDFDLAFQYAVAAIISFRGRFQIGVYKIGICANPRYRFWNDTYGYHFWGYSIMAPLIQAPTPVCQRMEKRLIAHFDRQGPIQNKPFSGGESPPSGGVCFLYCVFCEGCPAHGGAFRSRGPDHGKPQKRGRVIYR